MDSELFAELKNYLNITWDDVSTDNKLEGILRRAINILQSHAGCRIDFDGDSEEKQLLFDCCRYIINDAYEDFKINFHDDLIMLREQYQIKHMEKYQ